MMQDPREDYHHLCVWKSRHFSTAIIRTNQSFISSPSVSRRISPVKRSSYINCSRESAQHEDYKFACSVDG